ncbi:MAG: TonB-dependent receptor [Woeseiaceae bacterium]|nr:TonB-dependent receptor [Woeseiaceae bacterium]
MKSTRNSLLGVFCSAVVSLATITTSAPAFAQNSQPAYLEEIVVQAQRRDQNLTDVPVSVTLVSGAEIEASGIKDMFDLQQNVPGLIVGQSQTTTSSNFAIRGIGSSSNNFGVESSVGLYVDGVYRSRQSSMINELIDVEAAEVLRGPQGTLFGKNSAAGSILLRTVAPDPSSANAFIDVTAGDYGLVRLAAATNIGINDKLAFRGTLYSSQRDGYVSDVFMGEDVYNNRDRFGLRMQLGMNDASDDFNMRIIADYSEIDENCCVAVSRVDGLLSQASIPAFPALVPGSDAALLSLGGLISSSYPYPQALLDGVFGPAAANIRAVPFEDYLIAQNYLPESTNEDRGISVEINKAIGEMTLSSVTAFRLFDTYDRIDGDFTNVDVLERINIGEQQSISQEFRLSGDFGDKGSYFQVGAYFFGQDIDSVTHTNGGQFMEAYVLALQPQLVALINGVNAVSAGSGGALPPAASPFPPGFFVTENMAQEHKSWAVFGQTDLVFSDKVTLTLGARYTDENKTIHGEFTQTAAGPAPDLDAIALNLFYAATSNPAFDFVPLLAVMQPNNGWGGHLFDVLAPRPELNAELNDDQVTGTAKLSFFATENMMFYGSYATGFKAGGTNTDRISPAFNPVFGPETSTSLEVGFKGSWDRIRIGFSYYQTDYDDFQANSFTGTGFNLQNAGQIETDGWELEYQWQPFDNTTISGYFAKSAGEFKTFVGGTCRDEYVFHTGLADPGSGGDINAEVCDRSGDVIPYNPEDRAFIALTQDFPIGPGNLFFRAEYTYASELYTDGDVDPFTLQTGTDLINLRVGMDIDAWNSRITLWGRNITDERSYNGSFDQPLGAGRMNSYPTEPATYGISFTKNWD